MEYRCRPFGKTAIRNEEYDYLGDNRSFVDLLAKYKPHKLKRHDATLLGATVVVFFCPYDGCGYAHCACYRLIFKKGRIGKEGGTAEMLCHLSTIIRHYPNYELLYAALDAFSRQQENERENSRKAGLV